MAYSKTTWIGRVREFANRITLTNISGTTYDVSQVEGAITTAGTSFSTTAMQNLEDGLETVDTAINTSPISNGLELDSSGRLTLWEGPQTSYVYRQEVDDSIPSLSNNDYYIDLDNNYGNFYRAFDVLIVNDSDPTKWLRCIVATNSNNVMFVGTDYNGNVLSSALSLINSAGDLGCGCLIDGSGAAYAPYIEYDDANSRIVVGINSVSGGTYPQIVNFNITIHGLV
jgi:hypothetical protein